MSTHRYSPLAGLMQRELTVAGRLCELTDLQVSRGAKARLTGASGRTYLPDVLVRTGSQLHFIYMKGWRRMPPPDEVLAAQMQLEDIAAAHTTHKCSACIFATGMLPDSTFPSSVQAEVLVLAPPHCIGYAYFVLDRVLGSLPATLRAAKRNAHFGSAHSDA